jgi:hypothetical protein
MSKCTVLRPRLFLPNFFFLLAFLGLIDNTTVPSYISPKYLRYEARAEAVLSKLDANGDIMSHILLHHETSPAEQSQPFRGQVPSVRDLSCLRSLVYALDDGESQSTVRGKSEDKEMILTWIYTSP